MEQIKLPSFLCIGAAKSGTTTLHKILLSHPQIYLPLEKDFHFFDFDENYNQGIEWYGKYYQDYKENQVLGEISADYLYSENAVHRIKDELTKDIKIIVVLREPLERAYSEYKHKKRYLKIDEKITFEECYNIEKNRDFKIDINSEINFFSRGFYSVFLEKYESVFDKNNILLLSFDDLKKNQQDMINKVVDFLGIKPLNLKNDYKENIGNNYKYKILQKIMHQDNFIKRFAKKCVPNYKYRMRIKSLIRKVNSKDEITIIDESIHFRSIYINEKKILSAKEIYFDEK